MTLFVQIDFTKLNQFLNKFLVNELNLSGAFYRQKDVTQAAKDFITSTNKDPVSLLNIYSTISGEVPFKFFEYELVGRPDKKFSFILEIFLNFY